MSGRVLILGGGLAGLAAAYELQRRGVDAVVLEARSSPGGRTRSTNDVFPGVTLELGAEFIGRNHPRWQAYASDFGLSLVEIDWPPTSSVTMSGEVFTGAQLADLLTEYHELTLQLTAAAAVVDDERPWLTPDAAALDALSFAEGVATRLHGSERAKAFMLLRFHQSEAAPPEAISWLGQLTVIKGHGLADYWEQTDQFRCRGGVQQLARALNDRLVPGSVRCGCVATSIEQDNEGVNVTLSHGERMTGDWLILAIPPSQWPLIQFDPPLAGHPPLLVGAASKEFIRVADRYWRPGGSPLASCDAPQGSLFETGADFSGVAAHLVWYVAGRPAETVGDLSSQERQRRIQTAMESAHPGLTSAWQGWHAQDWRDEPYANGAYSYAQLGKATTWGPILDAGFGRISFAGEHASFRFTGYMEGALESAERSVRSILAAAGGAALAGN